MKDIKLHMLAVAIAASLAAAGCARDADRDTTVEANQDIASQEAAEARQNRPRRPTSSARRRTPRATRLRPRRTRRVLPQVTLRRTRAPQYRRARTGSRTRPLKRSTTPATRPTKPPPK